MNFLFLGQVETVSNSESDEYEDEEDEFFSCCEELSDEEKSASRRKEAIEKPVNLMEPKKVLTRRRI